MPYAIAAACSIITGAYLWVERGWPLPWQRRRKDGK